MLHVTSFKAFGSTHGNVLMTHMSGICDWKKGSLSSLLWLSLPFISFFEAPNCQLYYSSYMPQPEDLCAQTLILVSVRWRLLPGWLLGFFRSVGHMIELFCVCNVFFWLYMISLITSLGDFIFSLPFYLVLNI